MVVFPNCKINLGLYIGDKRPDGFHNLATIFYPVPLKDALEIIRQTTPCAEAVQFTQSGLQVQGPLSANLCVKAYELLKKQYPHLPSIKMHLHKAIPMGAGLGGGSADGAFTLQLLNQLFNLQLTTNQLTSLALQLGSDCPFFIINQPCLATGRGEQMQPLQLDLSGYQLIIINPGIHINTGRAFAELAQHTERSLQAMPNTATLKALCTTPPNRWKNQLLNHFELPVFEAYPPIEALKNLLYQHGADYAAMSGTGSTVFGLFKKHTNIPGGLTAGYYTHSLIL
jgi:4-diphosphocytidyl-2-C-methyl-D-erythritol kinase